MKNTNVNFLIGWFIVGFGIAYVLLNISKWTTEQNTAFSPVSYGDTNLSFLEKKQNEITTNYVRLPSFKRSSSARLKQNRNIENVSTNNGIDNHITAQYNVDINNSNIINVNTGINNSFPSASTVNYSTSKADFNSNNHGNDNGSNANLAQSITLLEAFNHAKPVTTIEGSSSVVKSKNGFLAINTDITSIESSLNINDAMQKSTSDMDPGDGGDDMGDPIPVGEGWLILLAMALGYAGLKSR